MVITTATENTRTEEWYPLPSGGYVSADRIQRNGKLFTLKDAADMDIESFNKEAEKYGVHIDEGDKPIKRLIKYSTFLSRKNEECTFVPTFREYNDMVLDTAVAKSRGEDPLASFYQIITSGLRDATREIIRFMERISDKGTGLYLADLLRFDEYGELFKVDEGIKIPGEGWIRALGTRHGYPIRTSIDRGPVETIENSALQGRDVEGFWRVGSDPIGEEMLTLRSPGWRGGGLLGARVSGRRSCSDSRVAALRLRHDTT